LVGKQPDPAVAAAAAAAAPPQRSLEERLGIAASAAAFEVADMFGLTFEVQQAVRARVLWALEGVLLPDSVHEAGSPA
jgi:hypothetical protein